MQHLAHQVPPDPHRYTVDAHAGPNGIHINGRTYNADEFAQIMRHDPHWDGKTPIRLIGCDSGSLPDGFAHDLSRKLGVPVTAPTHPAWTDGHGRVFSTSYTHGPNGTVHPKWPPDGEWKTFHPDGSSHPAGHDGFPPGHEPGHPGATHEHDGRHGPGEPPDDARARGNRYIPDEPVHIETVEPPASMEEKLNNKEYRDKYFDGPDKNGEYSRKNATQTDANDEHVPKLKYNPEDHRFEPASEDFTPAKYREDMPEVKHNATPEQKHAAQDIVDRRAAASERTKHAEENYQNEKATGSVNAETAEERRAAHQERTDVGEELGEHAASDAVKDMFPPDRFDVTPRHGDEGGAGRFDQVYEVHNKETGETRYVIVEAKGPNADLGTRQGLDGKNYQQGHPRYVESVVDNMRRQGTNVEKELADDLEVAALSGSLDYMVAKARVGMSDDGALEYGGYNLKHFDVAD